MVSALVWVHIKFLGKTLNSLALPLSTQVYKWVPANLMLGVTLRWTSIPSRDSWLLHATEPDISSGMMTAFWLVRRLYPTQIPLIQNGFVLMLRQVLVF